MIKQSWNRFGQNTSIAPSKSSKTIRSKFITNTEEENGPAPIYFKQDPIRQEIVLRARRETNRISPQPKAEDRLGKISKLVSELHRKKDEAKKRLDDLKQQVKEEMDKKYTFTPERKKVPKYVVTGDVIRRNQVWMQEKNKKHLYLKEQRTMQELKQCTFSPTFQAKKQSSVYLKNKNGKSLTPRKSQTQCQTEAKLNNFYSPAKSRKSDITVQQFETAKKYLVSKIMNTRII